MARANSTKPSTTLTELSQPPEEGMLFNQLGNMAKRPKGMANATPKPSIPETGSQMQVPESEAAVTSRVPMMGPVQEKETTARVRAMKKIPIRPPLSDLASSLVDQLLGRVGPGGKISGNHGNRLGCLSRRHQAPRQRGQLACNPDDQQQVDYPDHALHVPAAHQPDQVILLQRKHIHNR